MFTQIHFQILLVYYSTNLICEIYSKMSLVCVHGDHLCITQCCEIYRFSGVYPAKIY